MNARPILRGDAEAIAAVARADEEALRGRPSHVEASVVAGWWARADLEHDSWLFEEHGAVVAAGWFQAQGVFERAVA